MIPLKLSITCRVKIGAKTKNVLCIKAHIVVLNSIHQAMNGVIGGAVVQRARGFRGHLIPRAAASPR